MDVAVIGAGYVGLVTAACLTSLGNRVRCIDVTRERIELLRHGTVPLNEPDLERLVHAGLDSGRLTFHADASAARGAELAIVSVGTLDADGQWTAAHVRVAVLGLAADPAAPRRIVIRSTLLPGTAATLGAEARRIDPGVRVAMNPEFTREGSAVSDFLLPQRVVVGIAGGGSTHAQPASIDQRIAGDEQASALVATILRLYEPLGAPTLVTDLTSAEMIKVASNVFLAAKITFANELARLSVATGADAQAVVEGLGLDGRIGRAFLSPGPGYGGSCLPSQARALPDLARRAGVRARLMDAIAPSNDDQVTWLLDRAEAAHGGSLAGARVALLGLTFKAGTDDLRESPSLRLAVELVRRGAAVVAHDPLATAAGVARLARVERIAVEGADDVAAACSGADVVIVATEWPAFRSLDWRRIARSMRGRVIADARSIVDAVAATRAGLRLVGLPAMPVPGPAMTRAMATAATMNVPAARRLSADRAPATGVTGKAAGPASDQARSRRPAAVGAPAAVAALVP